LVGEGHEVYEGCGKEGLKAYVFHHLFDEMYETLHREVIRRGRDIGIDLAIELARVKVTGGVSLGSVCEDVSTFLQDNGPEIYYDFLSEIEHLQCFRRLKPRRSVVV
jgi:hypothetical protein